MSEWLRETSQHYKYSSSRYPTKGLPYRGYISDHAIQATHSEAQEDILSDQWSRMGLQLRSQLSLWSRGGLPEHLGCHSVLTAFSIDSLDSLVRQSNFLFF